MAIETEKRRIRHGLFSYTTWGVDPISGKDVPQGFAFGGHNEIVDLHPSDIRRGEAGGAFYDTLDESEPEAADEAVLTGEDVRIGEYSTNYTDAEVDAWVATATVAEVSDVLAEYPAENQRIYNAEQKRDEPRKGVVEAVARAKAATS